ncbi:Putative 4,5-dihydroxyphthalate dehydrogenase [Poriferisphaera corsica]|uniref:4,5-dihydroxyphthalate dehydrogenase n=1 Tax=Poriferisphaera corsica TaxID=2528020 RepID=A0A517YWG5_9BACT|nr:Gfo/Idh/MocA family oxidoreductase [Poriferisphaera corsica]QDU34549.1 Putative 4,5-dihydroxyphthalate dehydrogenase [Poriferisphaera corsica]
MKNGALKIGFIGLHHQHPRWYWPLWNVLPMYKPVAVCDGDADFLAEENKVYGLKAFDNADELIEQGGVDVVMLWEKHTEMPRLVEAAARCGKHVIVEKPCAANVEGVRAIEAAAKRYPGVKISSPYCWRTHRCGELIKKVVESGEIGEVVAVEGRLNAGGAWRYVRDHSPWMLGEGEGGGPMWNLGVHWIDFFRWVLDKEVLQVCGQVGEAVGEPVRSIEDQAQALLRFEGGCVGLLDISYGLIKEHPGVRDIYVSIRGTEGAIQWTPAWEGVEDEVLVVKESGAEKVVVKSELVDGYCGEMAKRWLEGFASAVSEGGGPLVGVEDMVAAIEVVDAFRRSVVSERFEWVGG